jgi:deazaflavin-dependent oxidoreductase (nitroreductase family)
MAPFELPPTGTCDLSTTGRRSGIPRRVELWYVVVDEQIVLTGTPGPRHWLSNLRANPDATLHLRRPHRVVPVRAEELTDGPRRRHVAEEAWRLQPWYAAQPSTIEDWVTYSPMVVLTPISPSARNRGTNVPGP